jgi:hypothetical protein
MSKLVFYKPNSDMNKGAAVQVRPDFSKSVIWIEMARQNQPKGDPGSRNFIFDWPNKGLITLDLNEMAEIIGHIQNFNGPVDLYHSYNDKVSKLKFTVGEKLGVWILKLTNLVNNKVTFDGTAFLSSSDTVLFMKACESVILNHINTPDEPLRDRVVTQKQIEPETTNLPF